MRRARTSPQGFLLWGTQKDVSRVLVYPGPRWLPHLTCAIANLMKCCHYGSKRLWCLAAPQHLQWHLQCIEARRARRETQEIERAKLVGWLSPFPRSLCVPDAVGLPQARRSTRRRVNSMLCISSPCSLDRCASASRNAAVFLLLSLHVSSTLADPAVRQRVPTRNEVLQVDMIVLLSDPRHTRFSLRDHPSTAAENGEEYQLCLLLADSESPQRNRQFWAFGQVTSVDRHYWTIHVWTLKNSDVSEQGSWPVMDVDLCKLAMAMQPHSAQVAACFSGPVKLGPRFQEISLVVWTKGRQPETKHQRTSRTQKGSWRMDTVCTSEQVCCNFCTVSPRALRFARRISFLGK